MRTWRRIAETREVISTTTSDQFLLTARPDGTAVLSVHIEGGKRNGTGVQIDLTGDAGDLRVTNTSALGDVVEGARGDLAAGSHSVPTFEDAVWLHRLFDNFETSNNKGARWSVG